MQVTVIAATQSPMDVIGIAAGMCYGKPEPSAKRVRRCAENGHMSVFEHASATFKIEGISRACLAQLTPIEISYFDPRTGEPSPTRCAPLHADGRAGIKRDTNGDPLVPLPKRAKPKCLREAESRRRGNAASAKARGKRGARL